MSHPVCTESARLTTPAALVPRARPLALLSLLLMTAHVATSLVDAAGQPYKDRRVVDVLREFQRQGVRIIFSTGLVRPDMRVGDEPVGDDRQKIITAILAPHGLVARVGLRGILLIVRSPVPTDLSQTMQPSDLARSGAISGIVRDSQTRRPIIAAVVRIDGTVQSTVTDADGAFRLEAVPVGVRTLIVDTPGYLPLRADVSVPLDGASTVTLEVVRAGGDDRLAKLPARLALFTSQFHSD
jgi:hypothetical protein